MIRIYGGTVGVRDVTDPEHIQMLYDIFEKYKTSGLTYPYQSWSEGSDFLTDFRSGTDMSVDQRIFTLRYERIIGRFFNHKIANYEQFYEEYSEYIEMIKANYPSA